MPFGNDDAMDRLDGLDDGSTEVVRTASEPAGTDSLEASFDIKPGTSTMIIPDPLEEVARIPAAPWLQESVFAPMADGMQVAATRAKTGSYGVASKQEPGCLWGGHGMDAGAPPQPAPLILRQAAMRAGQDRMSFGSLAGGVNGSAADLRLPWYRGAARSDPDRLRIWLRRREVLEEAPMTVQPSGHQ